MGNYYDPEVETASREEITGVKDLHLLPFVTKNDLRDEYPYGFLATPRENCVRIQSTSGTTGRRVVAFYTTEDVVHVSYGYGLFTGGPGLNGGSHMVGSLTLPMSSGNTDRQLQFMTDWTRLPLQPDPDTASVSSEHAVPAFYGKPGAWDICPCLQDNLIFVGHLSHEIQI